MPGYVQTWKMDQYTSRWNKPHNEPIKSENRSLFQPEYPVIKKQIEVENIDLFNSERSITLIP